MMPLCYKRSGIMLYTNTLSDRFVVIESSTPYLRVLVS